MFSGLIGYRGTVEEATLFSTGGMHLRIRCEGASDEETEPKDSIAVNGVCLTATAVDHNSVAFDVVPETLQCSTLGALREGDRVNVEYSLRVGDRMGGHFVYGHVDAASTVLALLPEGQGLRMRIETPEKLRRFVCEKGFISVDGVSVTIALADEEFFEIALIPQTLARTTLGARHEGDRVNLEADPIARYAKI
ncbi:MAG: riboflavin synthase [Candidatus Baltobacteraceae bacterium]